MTSCGRTVGDDPAAVERDDAVGGDRREVEVVEDGEHPAAGRGMRAGDSTTRS